MQTESANVLCKWDLLMCCVPKYVECIMHHIHKCNMQRNQQIRLVSAYNYFIQIMHVIKWSSSLSMWCRDFIAQSKYPKVLFFAYTHMICMLCMSIFNRIIIDYVLVVDAGLWNLTNDYVDSLQSIFHSSVDQWFLCTHLTKLSLMSLVSLLWVS
jgi:hypothetical protein